MEKTGLKTAAAVILGTTLFWLSGCALADTPQDELIVRQRETEEQQAETVASADGLTIAGQVQAETAYKCALEKGSVDILVHADVEVPDEESFLDWRAVPRYFEQEDIDGWIQVLAQGKPLWDYEGESDMYYMSCSELPDWMSQLGEALDEVNRELETADEKQVKELLERENQLSNAIELCESYMSTEDFEQDAVKTVKEWKLSTRYQGEEDSIASEAFDDGGANAAAGQVVSETQEAENGVSYGGELSGDKTVEELSGFVDIQDVFAPWADQEEKTYSCGVVNDYTNESLGARSAFWFSRTDRNAYFDDPVNQAGVKLDTKVSRKTMRKAADALLKTLGIEDMKFAEAVPVYSGGLDIYPDGSHFLDYEKAWKFCYARNLEGIPVVCASEDPMTEELYSVASYLDNWYAVSGEMEAQIQEQLDQGQRRKEEEDFWRQETLQITFDDEGLVGIQWENPCTVQRISGESVFLLPFSEIRQIFETSMPEQPLFELFIETGISLNVDVTEVRLGYLREYELDASGNGRMVPVWDFLGMLEAPDIADAFGSDAGSWSTSLLNSGQIRSLLTINATDGTIVKR